MALDRCLLDRCLLDRCLLDRCFELKIFDELIDIWFEKKFWLKLALC